MKPEQAPDKLSYEEVQSNIRWNDSQLKKVVKPLEEMRIRTIPEAVAARVKQGNAFLEKTELLVLVEWRAHRAKTYSSAAGELAAKNSLEKVKDVTTRAFVEVNKKPDDTNKPIKILQELEGVTLQTATLILSTHRPDIHPYFSDELDRYIHWPQTKQEHRRADKNITHTMKEYHSLVTKVRDIRDRIQRSESKEVTAVEIETTAYQLCKLAEDTVLKHHIEDDNAAPLVPEAQARKKRKTNAEKYEEEHPRGSEDDPFKEIHVCIDKGASGSPTLDRFGFELDYAKCVEWARPVSRSAMKPTMGKMKREEERWAREEKELERMAELMGDAVDASVGSREKVWKEEAYKEKVRRDLGQDTYQVPIETAERWYEKGFRAEPGEFDIENVAPEKRKFYKDSRVGCALRK